MIKTVRMQLDVTKAWTERKFQWERQVTACRFSPCGNYLVAGGVDFALQRWGMESDERVSLEGHQREEAEEAGPGGNGSIHPGPRSEHKS